VSIPWSFWETAFFEKKKGFGLFSAFGNANSHVLSHARGNNFGVSEVTTEFWSMSRHVRTCPDMPDPKIVSGWVLDLVSSLPQ
jgi:hypothetical protein